MPLCQSTFQGSCVEINLLIELEIIFECLLMASIFNDQFDVFVSGELDARCSIIGVCNVDRVLNIIANETFLRS